MKTSYTTPEMQISEYVPGRFIAMSWSDEETDEALVGRRSESNDGWEEFWRDRE